MLLPVDSPDNLVPGRSDGQRYAVIRKESVSCITYRVLYYTDGDHHMTGVTELRFYPKDSNTEETLRSSHFEDSFPDFVESSLQENDSFYVYTFKLTGLQDIYRMLDFIETENLYDFEIDSIPEAVSAEEYTQELQKYEYRRADPSEFSLHTPAPPLN